MLQFAIARKKQKNMQIKSTDRAAEVIADSNRSSRSPVSTRRDAPAMSVMTDRLARSRTIPHRRAETTEQRYDILRRRDRWRVHRAVLFAGTSRLRLGDVYLLYMRCEFHVSRRLQSTLPSPRADPISDIRYPTSERAGILIHRRPPERRAPVTIPAVLTIPNSLPAVRARIISAS